VETLKTRAAGKKYEQRVNKTIKAGQPGCKIQIKNKPAHQRIGREEQAAKKDGTNWFHPAKI